MRLLELTPAETAFLAAPPAAPGGLQTRLTRKLAATLSARLRLPLQAMAMPANVLTDAPASPIWQPDAALASLWLVRRLGGQRVLGTTPFVPQTLIHTLDALLAECWLDETAQSDPPATLAWQLTAAHTQATLALRLPRPTTDMTRWARGVIRHA